MPFEAYAAFAQALADPDAAPPASTRGPLGGPDARRFAVYRNNVAVGLTQALEARFPVARRLVGDAFFRAMAGAFVARNKPADAVMIRYGADFPAFVRTFAPARELPYLADVAELENAWVEAYHAADAEPLTLAALAEVAPDRLERLRFAPHPAMRALRLTTPAASLWAAHQGQAEPAAPDRWAPEDALVTRPHAEVCVRTLPPAGFALLSALVGGAALGEAAAPLIAAGDDPGAHLVGFIAAGAFCALR